MTAPPPALCSAEGGDVSLWVFAISEESALGFEAAGALLSPEEHARAQRFHFPVDRERWTRSRALLRLCLGARLDADPRSLQFRTGPWGKPYLEGPHSGAAEFNLSHSGDFAAVVVSDREVGVDIECWKDLPVAELAAFAFRPEEHAAILAHPEPLRHFLELWTAKESVMKCTGQGLSLPPAAVCMAGRAGEPPVRAEIEGGFGSFALHHFCHPGMWMLSAAQRA